MSERQKTSIRWFSKDPDLAINELIRGAYRRVSDWKAPSMVDAVWKDKFLKKAVELYETNRLFLDPRESKGLP